MCDGARHELNVCGGRRDRMSIQKLKDLLFGPGGAGVLARLGICNKDHISLLQAIFRRAKIV